MREEVLEDDIRPAETAGSPGKTVHLLDFLIILSKRRKFILWLTFGAAILTALTVLVLPSRYTATSIIMPPSQNSSISSSLLGQLGSAGALASVAGSGLGIKNSSEMYVSLFRSRTVEDAMVQRYGLMERYHEEKMSDARRAFESQAKVVLGTKDGLIQITVKDRDPNAAAEIANGYVDEFKKLSANLAITEASQRRAFFRQQLLEAKENLTAAEETLKRTEQTTGVLQIDSQARSLIEAAASLRAQVVAKEVQIQAMRSYATQDNPEMVLATQQLDALKGQLAKMAGSDQNSGTDFIVPKGKVPEAGMEYLRKLRDVKYFETISELIAKQFELAKLDEARQGTVIQVVDKAVAPDTRSFPKRTLTVIVMTILAFVLASGWAVFADGLHRMKTDPAENRRIEALRQTFR